jgi:hypothetical protein
MDLLKQKLKQLATWTGWVGWVTVIGGVLSAIGGLFAFIVGAIPGIIALIMGLKLLSAKKHAEMVVLSAEPNETENLAMISELTGYFKIQGILIIIGLALTVVGIIVGLIGAFSFANYLNFNY